MMVYRESPRRWRCSGAMFDRSSAASLTSPPLAGQNPSTVRGFMAMAGLRQRIALLLLHCYVFLLTFGMLQRPFGNSFRFGLSSIVSLAVIALMFREAVNAIKAHKALQMWLILVVYVCLITPIANPERSLSDPQYLRIAAFLVCCLICAAAASLPWRETNLRSIGMAMAAGLTIAGVLSVLDDAGVISLPFINISLANDPPIREPVAQFGHRSVMSLYLGVMLPFLFVLEDRYQSWRLRAAVLFVGACFLYFLIYSRNRSGFGAIAIALAVYYVFNLRYADRWLHPRLPGFVLAVALAFAAVFWFRPDQGATFVLLWLNSPFFADLNLFGISVKDLTELKLNMTQVGNLYQSDMLRVNIVEETFSGLDEHFAGRGFMDNTHVHFVIDIVYAAGYVGIVWLSIFTCYLAKLIGDAWRGCPEKIRIWLLLTPLIAWFWVGVMYNAINLGLGWIFFGMLLAISKTPPAEMHSGRR